MSNNHDSAPPVSRLFKTARCEVQPNAEANQDEFFEGAGDCVFIRSGDRLVQMCTADGESLKQCLDRHTITGVPGRQVGGVMEPRTLEPSTVSDELQKQIARLAFQLYESRGREDGHDVEDWMQAEAVLRREAILPKSSIAAAVYED